MIKIDDGAFYTVKDIADLTGKNLRTVREWIRSGKLRGKRVGRQWIVSGKDLRRYYDIEEHQDKLLIVDKNTKPLCQACEERPGQTVSKFGDKQWVCHSCENEAELLAGNTHRPVRY